MLKNGIKINKRFEENLKINLKIKNE